jgi:hypothetical protein
MRRGWDNNEGLSACTMLAENVGLVYELLLPLWSLLCPRMNDTRRRPSMQ